LEKDVNAGESFQPFLYFLMAARGLPQLSGLKSRGTVLKSIEAAHPLANGAMLAERFFSASSWETCREQVTALCHFLAGLAEEGNFFINPNESPKKWCDFCDYKFACRKNHPSSARRARLSAPARERARLIADAPEEA
jgi:hypothetical protein